MEPLKVVETHLRQQLDKDRLKTEKARYAAAKPRINSIRSERELERFFLAKPKKRELKLPSDLKTEEEKNNDGQEKKIRTNQKLTNYDYDETMKQFKTRGIYQIYMDIAAEVFSRTGDRLASDLSGRGAKEGEPNEADVERYVEKQGKERFNEYHADFIKKRRAAPDAYNCTENLDVGLDEPKMADKFLK